MNSPEEPGGPAESCDAFHGGRFHLIQPKGWGFRSGLDGMLLAASLPPQRAGLAADLGAGSGAAGFAAASRCAALRVRLVENDPVMAAFARRSIALVANAALTDRLSVLEADILATRPGREAAGLADGAFDTVMTNPPFHPPGNRLSPDAGRNAARMMPAVGFLDRWIRTAAALLTTNGILALLARPENLADILGAAENRLGSLRIVAVHPKLDAPAARLLVHARKGSRAALRLLPPIVLHEADGALSDLARGIAHGETTLDLGLV